MRHTALSARVYDAGWFTVHYFQTEGVEGNPLAWSVCPEKGWVADLEGRHQVGPEAASRLFDLFSLWW